MGIRDNILNEQQVSHTDCLIVGAGMIGASTALALAELGLKVTIIERFAAKTYEQSQSFDLRVSAISLASEQLLQQLGAWQGIERMRSCVYKRLGVWEDELSYAEFNADEISQSHLGHIIENRVIQLSLWQQMLHNDNITVLCPETLIGYQQHEDGIRVELEKSRLNCSLLIAADGANSQVRQLAGIGITGWDYQQSAMLINVETELGQQDITWQKFLPSGPLAFLPMPGNCASLVWYQQKDEIKRLSALSNVQLEQEIGRQFPNRLGKVTVIDKGAFPLTRRHANQYVKGNVVLLGDAAHTINPLAGQGVNLGFKDVAALQMVIAKAIGSGENYHSQQVLQRYEKSRRADNLMMMSGMDAIYSTFSNPSLPIKLLRNLGLFAAHRAPLLKSRALKYACGLA
ncbi:FAD-dependent oxidoreductase [Thalassotalea sp. HSM 43]|uniref:FAD-dependent oxidoreductase n=1 Tax=Thalassotalea sp. HSM 43 TaxID=2552945 RepID=UPI0010804AD1|nr:FAD-dependent oxidoreductase [Thalassotalea sp. HSM 43]QBY05391.1 FAD-dependent oxidoreductase [Thalassotalea sp. HSM 43]